MEVLLNAGLGNALAATILAVLIAIAATIARHPALTSRLGIVVLLKLLTPPLWAVSLTCHATSPPSMRAEIPVRTHSSTSIENAPAPPNLSRTDAMEGMPPVTQLGGIPHRDREIAPAQGLVLPNWLEIASGLWVSGTVLTFSLMAMRIHRFRRLLRLARPASPELHDRVQALANRLGLARSPDVCWLPGAVPPMIWAWGGRPRLILPDELWDRLGDRQHEALLLHELAHLKRHDHWVRYLELLTTGLYWWLPAVWWTRQMIREAEEQCCDAWVVWASPDSTKAYAQTLLDTVDFLSHAVPAVGLPASGLGHVHHLKRRLVMILNPTTPRRLTWAGFLVTLGLTAAIIPLTPSWAQRPADESVEAVIAPDITESADAVVTSEAVDALEAVVATGAVEAANVSQSADVPPKEAQTEVEVEFNFEPGDRVVRDELTERLEEALKPLVEQIEELASKEEQSPIDAERRKAIEQAVMTIKRSIEERRDGSSGSDDKGRTLRGHLDLQKVGRQSRDDRRDPDQNRNVEDLKATPVQGGDEVVAVKQKAERDEQQEKGQREEVQKLTKERQELQSRLDRVMRRLHQLEPREFPFPIPAHAAIVLERKLQVAPRPKVDPFGSSSRRAPVLTGTRDLVAKPGLFRDSAQQERRFKELETKLEKLLGEVEDLKKEKKP